MITFMSSREKPTALIIDDDFSIRLSMSAALQKVGFDTIEAESGQQGISYFKSEQPDLILLDVMMPDMNGFETCADIRQLPGGKFVQILMVTGLDDVASIEKAFEAGANDFISKPISWIMLGHRAKYMHRAGQAIKDSNRSQHRLAAAQEIAQLGNWEFDLLESKFHCSSEASRILGLSGTSNSITYEDFLSPVLDQQHEEIKGKIDNALQHRKGFRLNYRIIHSSGTQHHILNHAEILYMDNGEPAIMLGAVQDVTQLKNAEEEIRILAFYDSLTGLANRMLFMERLQYELSVAKRNGRFFALLFLDLDQFKRVNDTYGHHIGDLLLKNVAETLRKCVRKSDAITGPSSSNEEGSLIARLGGDEFIILLSDVKDPQNASIVARKILTELPEEYLLEGHAIAVTTSIGISVYPGDAETAGELLKCADLAMYHAKQTGRNKYNFFKDSLNIAMKERFSLEKDLLQAIENDELLLYYQPQFDLKNDKVVGAEALIRWLHPRKGMIPPDSFISIAEDTGIIVDINNWVIETACRQNREWIEAGFAPIRIAVNISGYKLLNQNIVQVIKNAIMESDLHIDNLEIELTENIFMQDTEETVDLINEIKDLSLRIALDDFGTGFSSLSYLVSFPVDVIKIDRSFVMGATLKRNNRVIIKAIIAMGHSLGMKIVAEGVENEEELALLKDYGADEAQGFYFSPAVHKNDFTKYLTKI